MKDNRQTSAKPRRLLAYVNVLGTTQLHLRNPYVVAFWSAMFPGFGHLLLSKYMRAYILFLFEIIVNLKAHVNLALLYTFLGEIGKVRDVVDLRWSLLYIPTFVFTVWDSYRSAVDMNKQYILADRENAPVDTFSVNALGITYLDKRLPSVASAWCAGTPGLGHIMLQRIHHGFFVLFLWIIVIVQSNVLTAVHLTAFGDFSLVRAVLNWQWFLNIPSLFFYCVYTTYVNTTESNKLFDTEQSQFLHNNYQSAEFPFMPGHSGEIGAGMHIISIFRQSIQVELAVTALEQEGVKRNSIFAVPVAKEIPRKRLFDTMYSSTGDSVLDLAMILGALGMLFGSIYGYKLSWGPILWGMIGAVAGFTVGLLIKLLLLKKKATAACENEVVVFVSCDEGKSEQIERLLRNNGALGVSVTSTAAE